MEAGYIKTGKKEQSGADCKRAPAEMKAEGAEAKCQHMTDVFTNTSAC